MSRRNIRKLIIQWLYSYEFHSYQKSNDKSLSSLHIRDSIQKGTSIQKRDSIQSGNQNSVLKNLKKLADDDQSLILKSLKKLNTENQNLVFQRIEELLKNKAQLDKRIGQYTKNWKMERMSLIDLNIMRLAIFEILFCEDIPDKVALNEALELAKIYGDKDSPRFINGILDPILKSKGV